MLEYELTSGERRRNTEFIRVRNDQIVRMPVFFGGRMREDGSHDQRGELGPMQAGA